MATYEVGQQVVRTATVKDTTGALANTGTLPTCQVTLPDATTASATVVNVSTGLYTASYVTTLAGHHRFRWSATGANSGGFPYTDLVDVWPADPHLLIGLDDARDALNFAAGNTTHDDELRLYIAAATRVIEDIAGTMLVRTITETHDGGDLAILLYEMPIASIVSVVDAGTSLVTTDYAINLQSGVLTRMIGIQPYPFRYGVQSVVVTYTAGLQIIPPNVTLAARELVRFMYQQGQQGGRPTYGDPNPDDVTVAGYLVPKRVLDLLGPQQNTPGIA